MKYKVKEIGRIPKNDTADVLASITTFNDQFYIDLREYLHDSQYNGPTKRGVRFDVENWELFYELMQKLNAEVQELGMD